MANDVRAGIIDADAWDDVELAAVDAGVTPEAWLAARGLRVEVALRLLPVA